MLHLFFNAKAVRHFPYRQVWPDKTILTYRIDMHNDEQRDNYSALKKSSASN